MSERSRVERNHAPKRCCWRHEHHPTCSQKHVSHIGSHLKLVCVTLFVHYLFMEFPVSTFVSLFSLSLHLLHFLYCCVAPGNTVMCPPSVPPSLSLSLCPCHLQLLCETRHTARGREAGRERWREGGKRGKEREERQTAL